MNKQKKLILYFPLFFLLLLGCISPDGKSSSTSSEFRDIVLHPENHVGKNLTLNVIPQYIGPLVFAGQLSSTANAVSAEDETGKPHYLHLYYPDMLYCTACEVTGTIKNISICSCEETHVFVTQGTNYPGPSRFSDMTSSDCTIDNSVSSKLQAQVNFDFDLKRCKSGTTGIAYYFDVNSVKKIN